MTIAYWPDNLWPPGYWGGGYWNAIQPAATLSLTTEGAFPHTGTGAGQSLRLTLLPGRTGRFVEHAVATPLAAFHVRLMLGLGDADGSVVLCQGLDATYDEAWRLSYDAVARVLRLVLREGSVLSDTLAGPLPWHCIEFGIDPADGSVRLWTNGLSRGSTVLALEPLATQRFRLGVLEKSADASGHLLVDAWQIDERYIGPPLLPPLDDHAGDPARWLVVYNAAWPGAAAWAEQYRQVRGIPYGNLLGLALGMDETIDAGAWASLRDAMLQYLDAHDNDGRILGILLGCGVPGYVLGDGDALMPLPVLVSVMRLGDDTANPLAAGSRPSAANLQGAYLTARLDALDAAATIAWAQTASDPARTDWRWGKPPKLWLSAHTAHDENTSPLIDAWEAWARGDDAGRTRMRMHVSMDSDPLPDGWPASLIEDGLFWGWVNSPPPADLPGEDAGPRGFAMPVSLTVATGPTLRDAGGTDWCSTLRRAGYLAIAAASGPVAAEDVPDLALCMAAMVEGWTIGEAWFASLPRLDAPLFLAGDPLMRIDLPRAGWDVFGPVAQLEHMTPDAPMRRLSDDVRELALPPEHWPADGDAAHYVVRRNNAHGHREAGAVSVQLEAHDQTLLPALWRPLWPDGDHWPVAVSDGAVRLDLLWDGPLRAAGVRGIELQAVTDAGQPDLVAQWDAGRESAVGWSGPHPTEPTRYRWRLVAGDGRERLTAWSQCVAPPDGEQSTLQLMETRP
jgi:hypothetical protein